jgi:hypothetical protein
MRDDNIKTYVKKKYEMRLWPGLTLFTMRTSEGLIKITVKHPRVTLKAANFVISWATISLSPRHVLHRVGHYNCTNIILVYERDNLWRWAMGRCAQVLEHRTQILEPCGQDTPTLFSK